MPLPSALASALVTSFGGIDNLLLWVAQPATEVIQIVLKDIAIESNNQRGNHRKGKYTNP